MTLTKCPRCGTPEEGLPALSLQDPTSHVCADCAEREGSRVLRAMEQMDRDDWWDRLAEGEPLCTPQVERMLDLALRDPDALTDWLERVRPHPGAVLLVLCKSVALAAGDLSTPDEESLWGLRSIGEDAPASPPMSLQVCVAAMNDDLDTVLAFVGTVIEREDADTFYEMLNALLLTYRALMEASL